MIIGFLFLVPAAIFTALEPKWGFSDALYYCFISLTTIGLGDFIPGDNYDQHLRPLYKACTTCKMIIKLKKVLFIILVYIVKNDFIGVFLISLYSLSSDWSNSNDVNIISILFHSGV